MDAFFRTLLIFSALIGLSACGAAGPYIDPGFTDADKLRLQQQIDQISSRKIILSDEFLKTNPGQNYKTVFGNIDGLGNLLERYIKRRVNYVLPAETKIFAPVEVNLADALISNVSPLFWYLSLSGNTGKIGDIEFVPKSPHTGVIVLGQMGISKSKNPSLSFLSTLIHEARHSDCYSKVTSEDLEHYNQGENMDDYSCGFPHVMCPRGHDLEGLYACDEKIWGAYAIQGLALHGIAQGCVNCEQNEKNQAEALALEALSRVESGPELFHQDHAEKLKKLDRGERKEARAEAAELFKKRMELVNQRGER